MRGQKFVIIFLIGMLTLTCNNVVIKNIKTNTVMVAKVDNLYELGDTIIYEKSKSEIIRKKLRDGTIIKKGPVIKIVQDKSFKGRDSIKPKPIPKPKIK